MAMSDTASSRRKWWREKFLPELPNYLTFLRLGLLPLFVVLMIEPSKLMLGMATAIFMFASFTDYIDGFIARKFNCISDTGKLLDPLADKLLVMVALVMLLAQRSDTYGDPWVPGWMVVMVLAREIWITGLRGVAATKGMVIAAGNSGKVKSFLQMLAIVFLLVHDTRFMIFGTKVTAQLIGLYMLFVSIVFSYWGAVDYSYTILRMVFSADKKVHEEQP